MHLLCITSFGPLAVPSQHTRGLLSTLWSLAKSITKETKEVGVSQCLLVTVHHEVNSSHWDDTDVNVSMNDAYWACSDWPRWNLAPGSWSLRWSSAPAFWSWTASPGGGGARPPARTEPTLTPPPPAGPPPRRRCSPPCAATTARRRPPAGAAPIGCLRGCCTSLPCSGTAAARHPGRDREVWAGVWTFMWELRADGADGGLWFNSHSLTLRMWLKKKKSTSRIHDPVTQNNPKRTTFLSFQCHLV